jgi:hypothetical protein
LLLKRLEYITAEPATAAARRRPLRSAEIAEIIAEIEELRGSRSGNPDQKRKRNRQRGQRAGSLTTRVERILFLACGSAPLDRVDIPL